MEKFIPYEKLQKKKKRELDKKRRADWGEINPVTRRPQNPKAYNRKKARKWSDDSSSSVPFTLEGLREPLGKDSGIKALIINGEKLHPIVIKSCDFLFFGYTKNEWISKEKGKANEIAHHNAKAKETCREQTKETCQNHGVRQPLFIWGRH